MMCMGSYFREHVCHFLLDELVGGKRSTKLLSGDKIERKKEGREEERGREGSYIGASTNRLLPHLGVCRVSVYLSSV